jgi:hypothetical protein
MRPQAAHEISRARVPAEACAHPIPKVRNASLQLRGIEGSPVMDNSRALALRARTAQHRIRQDLEAPLVTRNCPKDSGSPQGRPAWGIVIHY